MPSNSANRKIKKILIVSGDKNLREVLAFCFDGWGYEVLTQESLSNGPSQVKKLFPDVIIIDVYSATKSHLEACRALKNDSVTAFIPIITLINKSQLRTQLLDIKQGIDDYLIKPPDPLDLRVRVEMAIKRSQYSFYSTPLTGLPGGRIIEETLAERLHGNAPFSFGHLDIDHFKSFNDAYGYLKGDRAIMQTAYILYTTIRSCGNPDDFIGHIGGDDFVFLTTPDKYRIVCHNFITAFNRLMPFHYSPEDRMRGYIVSKDRTNKMKSVSLMTISIAVVNSIEQSEFRNTIEINERVAEVKRYLKTFEGSKFMPDRRVDTTYDYRKPQLYRLESQKKNIQQPLGQRLLARHMIDNDKLDEALTIHWRRGVMLGEALRELGYVDQKDLSKVLKENGR